MVLLAALLVGFGLPQRACAAAFIYQFDDVFDGSTPAGSAPWLTTSFTDISSGVVQMKISASGLVGSESLSGLFLNLDTADNSGKLSFTYVGGSGGFSKPSISTGNNKFKADGGGKYDIDLAFSSKSAGSFNGNEYVIYNISSSAFTLNAMDFDALSKAAGGSAAFLAAAEISGISSGCGTSSGWIAPCSLTVVPVPEPSTFGLMAIGAIVLGLGRWLRSARKQAAPR